MSSHPEAPGKIGRYQILGELGRGAMGRVYRAFDPNIGRNIAVKVIPLDSADPELATRFRREAQAAGILSHPNIVTIFDAGDDGGLLYIAMELVEGQTLQQMLSQGPLPLEQAISFCEQAGAALDHAHARAIIHRDIKPANIMVQAGVVKITDFGVAKSGAAGMTSTGQVLGTPQYLAPEVVRGGIASARSDIFSLGVVLYEMLTGKRAFAGDNISTVIYRIMAEHPPAPSLIVASLPAGVNYVVQKALAKEPDERYGSCAELFADLKNHPALAEQGKAATQPVNVPPPFPDLLAKKAPLDLGATQPLAQAPQTPSLRPPLAFKKKWRWSAAAVAVVLIFGMILWRGRSTGEPSPTITPSATPASVQPDPPASAEPVKPASPSPTAAGSALDSAGSPPTATRGATSPTGTAAGSANQAESRPPPPPPASQNPAPAMATAATMGRVVIHTEPAGARVIVNGKPTAYRSPVNFALAAGQYHITVEHDGYSSASKDVMVRANRAVEIRLELEQTGGRGFLHRLPLIP